MSNSTSSSDSSTTGVWCLSLKRLATSPSSPGSLSTSPKCHQHPFGSRRSTYRPFPSFRTNGSRSMSLPCVTPGFRTTRSSNVGRRSGRPDVSPHTPGLGASRTIDPVATSTTCRLLVPDAGLRIQGNLPGLRPSSDSGWNGPQGLRNCYCPLVCIEITSKPVLVTSTRSRVRSGLSLSGLSFVEELSRCIRVSTVGGQTKVSITLKVTKLLP
jgi:hypothetical protein